MREPWLCQFILTDAKGDYVHCTNHVAIVGARFCFDCEERSRAIVENNRRLMLQREETIRNPDYKGEALPE